ncbi:BtrH N-terminal domain-containing protein [Roseateles sp. BYS180W]|uniref:BtrH N-terminal domain-containing protein n=1 Tax=Roseateles rivi TaxID=3299028 RepID=A0ABW7FTZ5_9BURK
MAEVLHPPFVGVHCESTMLVNLLSQQGVQLSEPMVFGLGQGLNFLYWRSANMPYPFIGGRIKPDLLTANLCEALALPVESREFSSDARAWAHAQATLGQQQWLGLKVDHYYLDYFGEQRFHFCAHYITLCGYDQEEAQVIDTLSGGGRTHTKLSSLALARAAKGPMSSRRLSVRLLPGPDLDRLRQQLSALLPGAVLQAIASNARTYLNPPIKNIAHRGIALAGQQVARWPEGIAQPQQDLPIIAFLMEEAGTGGGLFRRLWASFLREAQTLCALPALGPLATRCDALADQWSEVARLIDLGGRKSDGAALTRASAMLAELAPAEQALMTDLLHIVEPHIPATPPPGGAKP